KYLVVTMLAALTDHSTGNSTPRCSKLIEPSRQLVMTTSRRSHSTSSYGWTPAVLWTRSMRSRAPLRGAGAVTLVPSLTVSVMLILVSSSLGTTTAAAAAFVWWGMFLISYGGAGA